MTLGRDLILEEKVYTYVLYFDSHLNMATRTETVALG